MKDRIYDRETPHNERLAFSTGILRRKDRIARDRRQEFDGEILIAIKFHSGSAFITQEGFHETQLRSKLSGINRLDLDNSQSRPTTIRANLWNARVSKA